MRFYFANRRVRLQGETDRHRFAIFLFEVNRQGKISTGLHGEFAEGGRRRSTRTISIEMTENRNVSLVLRRAVARYREANDVFFR